MFKNTLYKAMSFLLLFVCSCVKNVDVNPGNLTSSTQDFARQKVDTSKSWYGSFSVEMQDPEQPDSILPDDIIIKNGEARIPSSVSGVWLTSVIYDLPESHVINMDSAAIDIMLKNNFNSTTLILTGSSNNAMVRYLRIKDTGVYTINLKTKLITAKVYPATDFTSFKLMRLAFKKGNLYLYVANKLITSFNYDAQSNIGKLKQIDAGGDGYIELDKVVLYNSFSRQILMKEDFNIDGQSHTIFY